MEILGGTKVILEDSAALRHAADLTRQKKAAGLSSVFFKKRRERRRKRERRNVREKKENESFPVLVL